LAKGKKFECNLNEWKYLASQNDLFTHKKVCTQMGSGHPSVCTTSDFHAVFENSQPICFMHKHDFKPCENVHCDGTIFETISFRLSIHTTGTGARCVRKKK
jgi:hypothetical protein